MAAITYAARIQLDLAILVSSQTVIDLSRQRDSTVTENDARTQRVCEMAAAKVESRLGDAGSYDDIALTGNQIFLDFGVRQALLMYSQFYTLTLTDAGLVLLTELKAEIEEYRQTLVQEALLGTAVMDNAKLNDRYPHSTWGSASG